jgi:hypothetical protein
MQLYVIVHGFFYERNIGIKVQSSSTLSTDGKKKKLKLSISEVIKCLVLDNGYHLYFRGVKSTTHQRGWERRGSDCTNIPWLFFSLNADFAVIV